MHFLAEAGRFAAQQILDDRSFNRFDGNDFPNSAVRIRYGLPSLHDVRTYNGLIRQNGQSAHEVRLTGVSPWR